MTIYVDEQIHRDICRGRFIAPIADLSAPGSLHHIPIKKLMCITCHSDPFTCHSERSEESRDQLLTKGAISA